MKRNAKVLWIAVAVIVLVVVGLVAKNKITESVIGEKIAEAQKTILPNMVKLSYSSISCNGLGFAICSINNMKISESGYHVVIEKFMIKENSSLASFGMKNMTTPLLKAEGNLKLDAVIENIQFKDPSGKSVLPPILRVEKSLDLVLKNGLPESVNILSAKVTTPMIDISLSGLIKDMKFSGLFPVDKTISSLKVTLKNKDLKSVANLLPISDSGTKEYFTAIMSGQELMFPAMALATEPKLAQDLFTGVNNFHSGKAVTISLKNKTGVSMNDMVMKLQKIGAGEESVVFDYLNKNFTLSVQ